VPSLSTSEQKIIGLCSKIAAMDDSDEFGPILNELRDAIRQHLTEARDRVADFVLVVATLDESKSAA
jgi:hypothetical protein